MTKTALFHDLQVVNVEGRRICCNSSGNNLKAVMLWVQLHKLLADDP